MTAEEIAIKLRYEMQAVEYARQQGGMSETDLKSLWNDLSSLVSEIDKLTESGKEEAEERYNEAALYWEAHVMSIFEDDEDLPDKFPKASQVFIYGCIAAGKEVQR